MFNEKEKKKGKKHKIGGRKKRKGGGTEIGGMFQIANSIQGQLIAETKQNER